MLARASHAIEQDCASPHVGAGTPARIEKYPTVKSCGQSTIA
jgi:hypothetical protein